MLGTLVCGAGRTGAAGEPGATEYLRYKLPPDAIKKRYGKRDGALDVYFDKKHEHTSEEDLTGKDVLARERIRFGTLCKRELFLNGKRHGVQLEWHSNGKLSSAIPYLDGVMHGVCMHWDEKGSVVGCYRIERGEGTKKVYHSNGRPKEFIEFQGGVEHGERWIFHDNGNPLACGPYRNGKMVGLHYGFHYDDGSLYYVCKGDEDGEYHGPFVRYTHKGELKSISYYLHGKRVPVDEYRKAAETDRTLPRFRKDPQDYRQLLTQETKDRIKAYKAKPRAKIPLAIPEGWKQLLPRTPAGGELEPAGSTDPVPAPSSDASSAETAALREGGDFPVTALAAIAAGLLLLVAIVVIRRRRAAG
jgi:antitoxin component YwqK of YwqJK toxin-antitoxin module